MSSLKTISLIADAASSIPLNKCKKWIWWWGVSISPSQVYNTGIQRTPTWEKVSETRRIPFVKKSWLPSMIIPCWGLSTSRTSCCHDFAVSRSKTSCWKGVCIKTYCPLTKSDCWIHGVLKSDLKSEITSSNWNPLFREANGSRMPWRTLLLSTTLLALHASRRIGLMTLNGVWLGSAPTQSCCVVSWGFWRTCLSTACRSRWESLAVGGWACPCSPTCLRTTYSLQLSLWYLHVVSVAVQLICVWDFWQMWQIVASCLVKALISDFGLEKCEGLPCSSMQPQWMTPWHDLWSTFSAPSGMPWDLEPPDRHFQPWSSCPSGGSAAGYSCWNVPFGHWNKCDISELLLPLYGLGLWFATVWDSPRVAAGMFWRVVGIMGWPWVAIDVW